LFDLVSVLDRESQVLFLIPSMWFVLRWLVLHVAPDLHPAAPRQG
jgi:hypothetical protein